MSQRVLYRLIDELRSALGNALIATDIWEKGSGTSLAGYNEQPAATKLFDDFYVYLEKSLEDSRFPPLARYFLLELAHQNVVMVINYGPLLQGMLVDLSKANMGTLVSLTVPKLFRTWDQIQPEL